jgi:hypothetical protein
MLPPRARVSAHPHPRALTGACKQVGRRATLMCIKAAHQRAIGAEMQHSGSIFNVCAKSAPLTECLNS